jgi:hypothetical protein
MAGDWLKIEKATARKPEVLRIAELLSIHPDHAFGLCFRFWSWCDDQLSECNAVGVTESAVDVTVGRDGFAQSLIKVGWLLVRNGSLEIPNFDRHLSESSKKRALSAKRTQKTRSNLSRSCNAASVTQALPEKRREEKRRVLNTEVIGSLENQIKQDLQAEQQTTAHQLLGDALRSVAMPASEVPLPDVLDVPSFQAVWKDWLNYITVQKRYRYAQDTLEAHLMELSRDGPITAAKRLEHAKKLGITYPANLPQDKTRNSKPQTNDWRTKARVKHANTGK